jgi:uncharacterized repeat protein (TIGR03803 family)
MNSINRQVKHSGMAAIALTMLAAAVILAGISIPAQAQTETLLHQFTGSPDGANPSAGPALKGTTLYGTTYEGGGVSGSGDTGYGIVYAVNTTTGKETILHTFTANTQPPYDGTEPLGGLAVYKGNLYGTTSGGGLYDGEGYGTIYEIAKSGKQYVETVLYAFSGGLDGGNPWYGTLVFDKAGNLYGTTVGGGYYGNGAVFKLAGGTLTTLHSFNQAGGDGYNPDSGVALDTKGNVYGTAPGGGAYGLGVLYEITAAGQYSILYNFTGGADGGTPRSALVYKAGKLYGTAQSGGAGCTWGCGVIFEYTLAKGKKAGKETVLHTFNGTDGLYPMYGALVFDKLGNIYGTTSDGGPTNLGNVYKLAPDGTLTTLYNFDDRPDGSTPYGGVALDTKGNVYTTGAYGGNYGGEYGGGTVIKITP